MWKLILAKLKSIRFDFLGFFKFGSKDVGIDLGTANTLIYVKNRGIVLSQPSVIAVDTHAKKILAVGTEAKKMVGRAPKHIKVIRPLEDGVISNFEMTVEMLREFLSKVLAGMSRFSRIRVVIGVPSGVTEVEKRAVEEVVRSMGARDVYILEEPMAAAIGVGLPIDGPTGCMVADVGGGTSDIAVIALEGIVTSTSLRHAGDKLNEAIVAYMRKNYELHIGDNMAEELKIQIGCAWLDPRDEFVRTAQYSVSGRDIVTGLPRTYTITPAEIHDAMSESLQIIVDAIKTTLENAPPAIAADIANTGIVLTGGGALIRGIDRLIAEETGLRAFVAENALEAVAEGTGTSLSNIDKLQRYASNSTK
ncbi:MAG: rod shape-determining protein [Clostridiales Family XIII bacterium]|jgi:rod shape-determining protein MreB|nr:rod shape-determining protein [Clostridiales Family XIII bacterium]